MYGVLRNMRTLAVRLEPLRNQALLYPARYPIRSLTLHPSHRYKNTRNIATSPTPPPSGNRRTSRRTPIDETSISGAQHKPSLSISGPSLGYLIMELSPTTPEMLKDGTRVEGDTMGEEQRTMARRVVYGLMWVFGVPFGVGALWVGWRWWGDRNGRKEDKGD